MNTLTAKEQTQACPWQIWHETGEDGKFMVEGAYYFNTGLDRAKSSFAVLIHASTNLVCSRSGILLRSPFDPSPEITEVWPLNLDSPNVECLPPLSEGGEI